MIYNTFLFLLVFATAAILFFKAARLSSGEILNRNKYLIGDDIIDLVEEVMKETKDYDRDYSLGHVVNIESHPNFNKKRA